MEVRQLGDVSFRPEPSGSLCADVGSANVRRSDGLWNFRSSTSRIDGTCCDGTCCDVAYGRIAGTFWGYDRQSKQSRLQRLQSLTAPFFRVERGSDPQALASIATARLGDSAYALSKSGKRPANLNDNNPSWYQALSRSLQNLANLGRLYRLSGEIVAAVFFWRGWENVAEHGLFCQRNPWHYHR